MAADPAQVADVYRHTFAARLDAYADWDASAQHWTATRSELTVERILEGLRTAHPVSGYMENAEGATHIGAIDFDAEGSWPLALAVAQTMVETGATDGWPIFPMLERSRRGCHLWLVVDAVVPSTMMRMALREFVRLTNPPAAKDPKVELRPAKLEQRGPESLGAPLRLPMMSHPATGHRYPLGDSTGQPLGKSITEMVLAVDYTAADLIALMAERAPVPISEARFPAWSRRPARVGGDVIPMLTSHGVPNAAPGRSVHCPLHDDRQASLVISKDGERVWCKSPACVANNSDRGLGADQLAKALGALTDG